MSTTAVPRGKPLAVAEGSRAQVLTAGWAGALEPERAAAPLEPPAAAARPLEPEQAEQEAPPEPRVRAGLPC